MRHALRPHPNSRVAAGTVVEAAVERRQGVLALLYVVTGKDLLLPPLVAPTRIDELWKHTCFEVFVRPPSGAGYYEFNFAPSTQWAAYRFTDYRTGMNVVGPIMTPDFLVRFSDGRFEIEASIKLGGLPDLPPDAPWKIGLSAVIEDITGSLSYWALTHPMGKADFHHPDCFSLELPAA